MIKNYGLKLNETEDPKAYKLGATELPKEVMKKDGDWSDHLPNNERQFTSSFDTYGCTIFGTENIQQILEHAIHGKTGEYDERYNYNLVKISPPGADPHDAAESFRNDGVLSGVLPMTKTYKEYAKPRPMPNKYIELGIAHPYELKHQWLWQRSLSKEHRTKLIREYLKYSPLGVSVTAWHKRGGVYVDEGRRNTHWTVIYGEEKGKGWKVLDSYPPFKKILSYDHDIQVCKRYTLVPSTRKERRKMQLKILSLMESALNFMSELVENLFADPHTDPKTLPMNKDDTSKKKL